MNRLIAFLCAFVTITSTATAQNVSFEEWLAGFKADAAAAGIRDDVLIAAFEGISVNTRVYELNDNQPEFSQAIWTYLDRAVSETKIKKGRSALQQQQQTLDTIELAYGVDKETIVAIWGLESAYGAIMGDYDAIQALATLAYDGRRTAYGRSQLIGALEIIQNGFADRDELKGSWAGAMGHTQFIPTTYLAYAVDHNGDGRRDIWSDLGDVFASTANYLSASGFRANESWGVEVRLPSDFDFALADTSIKKPVAEWASLNAQSVRGSLLTDFDPNLYGRLIIPAGARGPAFLVFENFEAILKYNRSTSYALAVALLSERVAGSDRTIATLWPREDRPLSLTERKALQAALAAKGFNPGPVDGIIGAGTRRALREWQKATGRAADGYASAAILEAIKS